MKKQRADPDQLANELMGGASAFFRGTPQPTSTGKPSAPVVPEPAAPSDVTTSRHQNVRTSRADELDGEPTAFDITRETASRDSLRLSVDETKALDALRSTLKWEYDLVVSKNDICRVALHQLLEDFRAKGERSQAVTRLKKKTPKR